MTDKTVYSLRVKCAPMQTPEGDKRYWYADHYGFSDDFNTPVVDDTNGPYGPPPLQIAEQAATERYAGSLIGTVARLQGYYESGNSWQRVAVTSAGRLDVNVNGGTINTVDNIGGTVNVSVLSMPEPQPQISTGVFVVSQATIGVASTLVASPSVATSYFRLDVVAGIGNVWVDLSGAAAVVGQGILVTPSTPLVIDWPNAPNVQIYAIATVANTVVNVALRG